MAEYEPLYIEVVTKPIGSNDGEKVKRIDYHSRKARDWLSKHLYWCFCNNHAVMIAKSENQEKSQISS